MITKVHSRNGRLRHLVFGLPLSIGYSYPQSAGKTPANQTTRRADASPFHQYELPNAVRLSVFRGLRNAAAGETILAAFEADLASGYFALPTCNLASVLIEARRLSASHTMTGGHRAFDILHVAAALHLGASEFLTLDTNQRKLATTVGLKPGP
jgi:predicted nucleic acid-binding protein